MRRRGAVALTLAALIVGSVLTRTPAHAVEGLTVDAHTTYRVDPQRKTVHVRVDAHLTNMLPSRTEGAYISTPYFDYFAIPLIGDVANVRARSSVGGDVSTRIETERGLSVLLVDLSPNLVHGTPQTITVEFELPGQPPRSRSVTRVNDGFASWFVFGSGDPGRIDITINVPKSFDLSLSKQVPAKPAVHKGRRVWRMRSLRRVKQSAFFAAALNDDRLSIRTFDVAGTSVTLKAWPDDARWEQFTARWVRRGLPVLEDLVGLGPSRDELTVLESSRTYHHGYAGVYVPDLGIMEVGDVLDESVLLHELSHMWFNDDMFTSRWISEGLAEEVANQAVAQLGKKPRRPAPIRRDAAGAVRLNEWSTADPLEPPRPAVEAYAYNASHAIVHEVVDEIGVDGLRAVVVAASQGRPAYALPEGEDGKTTVRDWRYFYDLVDQHVESNTVNELFRDHVLDSYERSLLRQRDTARARFDELVEAGDGWMPPLQLRQAMGNWSFDDIDWRSDDATKLLRHTRALVDDFGDVGIDAEKRLKAEYEGAGSVRDLENTLDEYERAVDAVEAVRRRVDRASPVARVGLVGADLDLAGVQRAIDAGDADDVPPLLAQASTIIDAAPQRGAAVAVAMLLLCAVVAAHTVRWRAARQRRRSGAQPATASA